MSYQPHFNTITKTGDANFSKIPHAVAELIDNSIQVVIDCSKKGGGRGGVLSLSTLEIFRPFALEVTR